jgi:hypothetical protein
MAYAGRCACSAVEIRIEGEPVAVRQCWCRQCQKLAAGGPTLSAIFRTIDITLTGIIASNSRSAASGNELTWSFCPACGTQIHGASSARPDMRAVRLGVLDDHGLEPTVAIWTDEAPAGTVIDPKMEQFPAQPAAPGTQR